MTASVVTSADSAPGTTQGVLAPRRWWIRTLAVIALLGWAFFARIVIGFLTLASTDLGWAWAALAYAPGVTAAVALFGVRRNRDKAVAILALSAILGGLSFATAPPDHARIERVADRALSHLAGARVVDHREDGNTWCFKGCPRVSYAIDSDLPPAQAAAAVAESLRQAGWHGGSADIIGYGQDPKYKPQVYEQWSHGFWDATVTVPSEETHRYSRSSDLDTTTRVEVTFER